MHMFRLFVSEENLNLKDQHIRTSLKQEATMRPVSLLFPVLKHKDNCPSPGIVHAAFKFLLWQHAGTVSRHFYAGWCGALSR